MSLMATMDILEKAKISCLCQELKINYSCYDSQFKFGKYLLAFGSIFLSCYLQKNVNIKINITIFLSASLY